MKLRKFKALVSEKGKDDFGFSCITFEVDQLVEGRVYEQADQSKYDEMGKKSKPFFVDDNGCSRDIGLCIKKGIIIEVI